MSAVSEPLTERPKNTSAPSSASASVRARSRPHGRLPLVHAVGAALVDDALGVAEDDVVGREPHRLDEFDAGDAGGPGTVDDEARRRHVAAGDLERVEQAGGGDDRGAVLVVMEHRDVHQFLQALLDDEAFRRLDVLQVDAAEGRAEIAHRIDELVGVLGVDLEIDGIDVGEALEQDRLAFHHGLGGERAEVAEAEDRRAVGDHRDHVAARRVVEGRARGRPRCLDRHRDAGRIGERQVALRRHRLRGHDLQLAGPALAVEGQRLLVGEARARPGRGGFGSAMVG